MRDYRIVLSVMVAVLAAGCASSEERSAPAPVEEIHLTPAAVRQGAAGVETNEVEVHAYQAPAVVALQPGNVVFELVEEAEAQRKRGDFPGAAATLERALRIEPRNPHLWNRLAHVRLEQGRFDMAGDLAAKSSALAGDNSGLKRDNWLVIAQARRAAGDSAGASAAERKAEALR